MHCWI